MAQTWYAHFDSTAEDPRQLLAADWAKFIASFLGDGIRNGGANLQITADGEGMFTWMDEGFANIQGYFFRCEEDYEGLRYQITHPESNPAKPRTDRVVLRLDRTIGVRAIIPAVITGDPGDNPKPPPLTRNKNIWEISLAQVRLPANVFAIKPEYIVDERLDNSVCGIINSLVSADTRDLFLNFQAAFESTMSQLEQAYREQAEENITQQLLLFQQRRDIIEDWFGEVRQDITKLQSFNFDNLFELPGSIKLTEFPDNQVVETIRDKGSDRLVARRITDFEPDGQMKTHTLLYAEDGKAILREAFTYTNLNTDGSIEEKNMWQEE